MTAPLALLFSYVWPEPRSSAAGVRSRELLRILAGAGWRLAAVSPSRPNPFSRELESEGIRCLSCDPNRSAETEAALRSLETPPALVLFDRFVMEEQFGWRVRELWPGALTIVDTQDLHSLRRARERSVRAGREAPEFPSEEELGDDLLRELASLHRVDLALVVSLFEERFLLERCAFPAEKLRCLPFSAEPEADTGAEGREGFCFLGNFRHPPNLDAARLLCSGLWARISRELPAAALRLYGAYPPEEISRFRGQGGVSSEGQVADHRRALRRHRALLAPLRFGAGIKGKVLEAWACGTPVIGSRHAFEGLGGGAGILAESPEEYASACRRLTEDPGFFAEEQRRGIALLRGRYESARIREQLLAFVRDGLHDLPELRRANRIGRMLTQQQHNASRYFSRWIEGKQRPCPPSS